MEKAREPQVSEEEMKAKLLAEMRVKQEKAAAEVVVEEQADDLEDFLDDLI